MTEPTTALQYSNFRDAIAEEIGYGTSTPTGSKLTIVERLLDEAYDISRTPTQLPGQGANRPTHQWSWLYPEATILLWPAVAAVATNTIATGSSANGVTPLTADSAVFHPSMVRQTIHLVTDDSDWVIAKYVSTTVVNVVGDASSVSDGDTFTIAAGQYGMPDDFAGIEEELSVAAPTRSRQPILITGAQQIRRQRNALIDRTGFPVRVAFLPRSDVIQEITTDVYKAVQRWDMVTGPNPNEDYTLDYKYRFRVDVLRAANPYPPGGPLFARVLFAACLHRAELYRHKIEGPRFSDYYRMLGAAISEDQRATSAERIGSMWKSGGGGGRRGVHCDDTLIVSVNGIIPD